jgi:hypothetical protein
VVLSGLVCDDLFSLTASASRAREILPPPSMSKRWGDEESRSAGELSRGIFDARRVGEMARAS